MTFGVIKAVATTLVCFNLAACGATAKTAPDASSTSPASSSASARRATTTLSRLAPVEVEAKSMAAVALDDSSIVVSIGHSETADTVERWTQDDGWSAVAESAWPQGFINWVGVSGSWVLYVDQSRLQDDQHMDVLWRIDAVNVTTGAHRTIASNGATADPWVPYLDSTEDGITWTQASPSQRANLYIWDGPHGHAVELESDVEMTPGSDRAAGAYVYYLGPNGRGEKGHTTGGDCWRIPRVGGTPQAITKTALALSCTPTPRSLFTGLHIDPEAPTQPAEGVLDDPYRIQDFDLSGDLVRTVETGYISDWNPVAVGTDVVWQTIAGVPVLSDPRGRRVPLGDRRAAFVRAAGTTIVTVSEPAHEKVVMRRYELVSSP